ncbi:hypothetical protein Patl1_07120 [Pistacia atlantica]|uniref:Uncharacterized protein n=1 Tax=Pistacia atlantica TaxID=434234 RepID=A0ACC1AFL5_9ROSI|nr:hypothetical protein Patl1_07120 [Pistacia atlantica]
MPFFPPRFCIPPPFYRAPPPPLLSPPLYRAPPPLLPPRFFRVSPSPPLPSLHNVHRLNYNVFINFRGEDTRQNITSHLYEALCNEGLLTFIDKKLERGHEIRVDILKAIEGSGISIIIFSEGYASSAWCLEELVKILECKKYYNQIVIPIFYHVDPSQVRHQTGTFANAFAYHEVHSSSRVHQWREALREAADISGFESKSIPVEAALVKRVIRDITHKICRAEEICRFQIMHEWQLLNNQRPFM